MNSEKLTQVLAAREGGNVIRCHTLQYIGPYNVAMHCYNALSLLLLLYPTAPSVNLIRATLWHDVQERWTGDIPAPLKWHSPGLVSVLEAVECQILEKLKLFEELSETETAWLRAVDLLELYIWTKEQEKLGNTNTDSIGTRIWEIFEKNRDSLPLEVWLFARSFLYKEILEIDELLEKL